MPNIGYLPFICFISSIVSVTFSGSPGPFEKNTPSGFKLAISSGFVLYGTTVTLQPLLFKLLTIFNFIPQSTATTLYFGFEVLVHVQAVFHHVAGVQHRGVGTLSDERADAGQ